MSEQNYENKVVTDSIYLIHYMSAARKDFLPLALPRQNAIEFSFDIFSSNKAKYISDLRDTLDFLLKASNRSDDENYILYAFRQFRDNDEYRLAFGVYMQDDYCKSFYSVENLVSGFDRFTLRLPNSVPAILLARKNALPDTLVVELEILKDLSQLDPQKRWFVAEYYESPFD